MIRTTPAALLLLLQFLTGISYAHAQEPAGVPAVPALQPVFHFAAAGSEPIDDLIWTEASPLLETHGVS